MTSTRPRSSLGTSSRGNTVKRPSAQTARTRTSALASHPAGMTHLSVPQARKDALKISDNLVRISIGVEDADDLIADFRQALEMV